MKRNLYILSILVLALSSCVYTFEPKNVKQTSGFIVIEGDINLGDESIFVISKSEQMNKIEDDKTECVRASEVYIESKSGNKYGPAVVETVEDKGYRFDKKITHTINTKEVSRDDQYRLMVKYNGREYLSRWDSFIPTPPIDSVTYQVKPRQGITISVSTSNGSDDLKYYMWSFEEDWEFKAPFYATDFYDPDGDSIAPLERHMNKYYCWKHTRSSNINVLSTESLSENKVLNHQIEYIPRTDFRISYVYSIEVHQKSISKEAYNYWETMLKNNDGTGGIFSPQPSEMRGNIICTEAPDEPVLGYVAVCSIQKKRIFIYDEEVHVYTPTYTCETEAWVPRDWWSLYHYMHYDVFYRDEMTGEVYWAKRECVDCRTRGTKNKPYFWPTEDI